ncbi:MAG: hypothetical protein RLZ44_1028 [Pseudomonadota bacterium]
MPGRLLALTLLLGLGAGVAAAPRDFTLGMEALVQGDYAEAYCRWKPLAERGYADAQYHLGWLYANGNGLRVDAAQAVAWWQRAAGQGHADAQFAMGFALTMGDGIERDLQQAVDWYLRAAKQGHTDARDILVRLAGDPEAKLMERHPELLSEAWFGWRGRVDGDMVNVRAGAGTEHKVVARLERDTQVRVIGRSGEWLRISFPQPEGGEAAGWIFENLVVDPAQ